MLYVMLGHVVMLSSQFCTEFGWGRVTPSPVKVVEPCSQASIEIAVFTPADAAQTTAGGNEVHLCRVMAPPAIWRVNLCILWGAMRESGVGAKCLLVSVSARGRAQDLHLKHDR